MRHHRDPVSDGVFGLSSFSSNNPLIEGETMDVLKCVVCGRLWCGGHDIDRVYAKDPQTGGINIYDVQHGS